MKGLIYREFYLSRKAIITMFFVYFMFVLSLSLVMISTYAGNLANDSDADQMRDYLYSQMYIYAGFISIIGTAYGHNDIIEKDYNSRWQLYSYTLPVDEKTIIKSKFYYRGCLLLLGFVLALLAEVIFTVAAREEFSMSHFKNIIIMLFGYGIVCISDIPTMLRFKTQAKAAAVGTAVFMPVFMAFMYGGYKFIKFCYAEGKRLYPDMDTDVSVKKLAVSYMLPYRDVAVWVLPVVAVVAVVLFYFWAIKELKRRRY